MNTFKIGKRTIGAGQRCFVIAEAGSNHNGRITTARKLIDAAADSGADAVKFQLFAGRALSSEKKMQDILKKFEFPREWLPDLARHAAKRGILLTATPFDNDAVRVLRKLKAPFIKIASCDLTHHALLKETAAAKKPIILSVGLASGKEIRAALKVIAAAGNRKVALLHCVVKYPAAVEDANLRVMQALSKTFDVPVGLSDHTMDTVVPALAVTLGASVIEKHLTLSRAMKGPDHPFALTPQEFKDMVKNIRTAEAALGDSRKRILPGEKGCLVTGRRSLYAADDIPAGERITPARLDVLRPAKGIPAEDFSKVIGKKTKRAIRRAQSLSWKDIA